MKKAFCLIISFLVLMSFGSCSWFNSSSEREEKIQTTSKRNIVITKDEVKAQVESGKIKGANFALGSKIDDVKEYFLNIVNPVTMSTTAKTKIIKKKGTTKVVNVKPKQTGEPQMITAIGENQEYYEYYKGSALTSVYYEGEKYFYSNDKIDKGAAMIVCSNEAFGFNIGNCPSIDITNSLGKPDISDIPEVDQLFFCLGSPVNPTRFTYNFGNKRLDFIFSDDNLLVVTLTDTSLYSGFSTGKPISSSNSNTASTADLSKSSEQ